MKPTRRRVLLGLGAVVGGGSLAYAGRDGERTRMGVRDRATDTEQTSETTAEEATTTDAETTTEEATTTERDVEFPDQFVRMSFDTRDSLEKFTELDVTENVEIDERGVVSESNSLRVTFPEGRHYGTSLHYRFDEADYPDPDELHARYYLRFGETFDLSHGGGGKLPGPSGTYGQAGWGGREADGTNGWSARMYFHPSYDDDHPIQLSSYVYHAEMGGPYGDIFEWNDSDAGQLHVGKWYRIDNYLRLNTPGEDDGVLKGWVNGERALDVSDLRFRDVPQLRIGEYWFDCYWGGGWHPPADNHVYFDKLALFSERRKPNDWGGTETGMTPRPETTTREETEATTAEETATTEGETETTDSETTTE